MRNWSLKSFGAGVLVSALVLGLGVPALATNLVTKELYYNNIQIRLNGETLIPKDANGNAVEPFVIDGTTYLPVRAVGEALGLNVSWDGATQTVILGNDPEFKQPAAWLGEMETFTGSADERKIARDGEYTEEFIANSGDKYERYLYLGQSSDSIRGNYTLEKSVSYLLKGEYSRFTGTFYLPEQRKDCSGESTFYIYLDDKLVYTSEAVSSGTLPTDFDIDISGAYKMEIICKSTIANSTGSTWHYYFTTPIANAALWTD